MTKSTKAHGWTGRAPAMLILVALLLLAAPAQARAASRPDVAVVVHSYLDRGFTAEEEGQISVSIADWSANGSPVNMVLVGSCEGYAHCIDTTVTDLGGTLYGVASGVGDAIMGLCSVRVAVIDSRLLDHEWGHCLGLEHTTVDTRSIVYIGGNGPYRGDYAPDGRDYRDARAAWSGVAL